MSLCVIDSGVGGFSVVRRLCAQRYSSTPIFYFADWAYAPYGCKTLESIQRRIVGATNWLVEHGVQRVVLGCHTASYAMLSLDYPLMKTMIAPTVRSIVCQHVIHGVVVLCTPLSFAHHHVLLDCVKQHTWNHPIYCVSCPDLAGFIEDQQWGAAIQSIMHALATVPHAFDRVVYGCTHYALLHDHLPESVKAMMVDPADYYDTDAAHGAPDGASRCPSSSVVPKVTTLFYTGGLPTASVAHHVHARCQFVPVPSSAWDNDEAVRIKYQPNHWSVGHA